MLIENFYTITSYKVENDELEAVVMLNKDHEVFSGHFPGNPVTPGVCMIQMIKELTEKKLEKELFLSSTKNVKFMAIVNPEETPELKIQLQFSEGDEINVKGSVAFNSTTAMKFGGIFKQI